MASLYLVGPATQNLTIASFVERDLRGHGPTTVTSSPNMIIPSGTLSLDYLHLTANLHAFADAYFRDKALSSPSAFINVFRKVHSIPVAPPSVMMSTSNMDKDALKGYGFREDLGVNMPRNTMINTNLSFDNLKAIWGVVDHHSSALAGNVNPAGLFAWYYAWKAAAIFTLVVGGRMVESGPLPVIEGRTIKRAAWSNTLETDDGDEVTHEPPKLISDEGHVVNLNDPGYKVLVVPRRSAVLLQSYTWTSSDKVTKGGVVLPYFAGMLHPDKEFVLNVFFRYFSRCMSDNSDGLASLVPTLRKGFRSLAMTPAGQELQHIFYGIQAAFETGAKLRILVDNGLYVGMVLIGGSFKILRNGMIIEPYSDVDVNWALKQLDIHTGNVARIVEILNSTPLKTGGFAVVDEQRARTLARYMANEIRRRNHGSSDDSEEIRGLVKDLRYAQTFWEKTDVNVARIPSLLLSGTLPEEEPFYHATEAAFSPRDAIFVLSVFGPDAPTVSIRTGDKTISIARPGADDPNLKATGDSLAMPYLPIYIRGLTEAAQMWEVIQSNKAVKVAGPRKKAAGKLFDRTKDAGQVSAPLFDAFYASLREWTHAGTHESKKRDREAMSKSAIEVSDRAKKRRMDISDLM
jgi:hypothetical protein